MKKEDLTDGFKLTLAGEVYTYHKDVDKWKQGRKDAQKEQVSMLEFIIKQLDAPAQEEIKNVDVDINTETAREEPAELVKEGKSLPKPTKRATAEKTEQAVGQETEEDSDKLSKKELLAALKSSRQETREKKATTKPESLLEEQKKNKTPILVKIQNISELARAIVDSLQKGRKVSGKVYAGGSSGAGTAGQGASSGEALLAEKLGPAETGGPRSELGRLTDLTEGEKELLKRRGVAPASEKDFSYRKDGKPLSKNQIVKELGESYKEGPFKKAFRERMRERNPYLRFFTNRLESPEDIAKGKTPKFFAKDAIKTTKESYQSLKESDMFKKATSIFKKPELKATDVSTDAIKPKAASAAETVSETIKPKAASGIFEDILPGAAKGKGLGFGKLFAKEGGEAAAKTGVKAAEKVVMKDGAKIAAKGLGKSLLKKIPGVGLLTGLALGAGRLMKGDFTGALGEVASGAASTLPGIGTATSFGIDAALAAKDMASADKPQAFADGGVVDKATPFTHSGGTGVMGEAGPEAIMPLKRDSSGKLGVAAEPVSKSPLTSQTTSLKQADEEVRKKEDKKTSNSSSAPTIINNTTNNTSGGGGGGGGMGPMPTAAPRGSLATNYFAF